MIRSVQYRGGSTSSQVMMAVVLLACFIACARAEQGEKHQSRHDRHDMRKQVEALEEKWRLAQLAGDVVTMDRMLSDDFIGISMSGQVNTKSQQLDRMRTHKLVITKIELNDMKVKLVGSVAIVTSRARVEGMNEGTPVRGVYRYTRVYQQLPAGEWKITSFEATKISPMKSAQEKDEGVGPVSSGTVMQPRFG